MDSHMNVFSSYRQQNEYPIENNMSRGLAILLKKYPELFYLFILKVNEKMKNNIPFNFENINSYDVDIQVSIDKSNKTENSDEFKRIIGVGLTSSKNISDFEYKKEEPNSQVILDIEINWGGSIVFIIECKRNEVNPLEQLNKQISTYESARGKSEEPIENCHISWTEILSIINKMQNKDWLVQEYYDYIATNRPELLPIKKLYQIANMEENDSINARLDQIMKKLIYKYNEDKEDKDKVDYLPPLSNMQYCKFLSLRKSENSDVLSYKIWIAEDKTQNDWFNYNCDLEKIKKLMYKNTKVYIQGVECYLTVIPYVKASWFMHVNAQSIWMYSKADINFDDLIKFANENFKKWYKNNHDNEKTIDKLYERINNSNLFLNDGIKEFEEEFVKGNHAECNFTISYECCISMKYKDAMKLENENKLEDTPNNALDVFRINFNK